MNIRSQTHRLFVLLILTLPLFARAQTVVFSEDFEGTFPGSWMVGSADPYGIAAYWGRVNGLTFGTPYAHGGTWSAYCAGVDHDGSSLEPYYTSDMFAYMIRSVSLSGIPNATLTFWYNIPSIENGYDYFSVVIDETDEVWFSTTATSGWQQKSINLNAYLGGTHSIGFFFVSDDSVQEEGAYIDDILLSASTVQEPRPEMAAQRVGDKFVVSWPTNSTGYVLHSSDAVPSATWTAIGMTPVVVGDRKYVTNNIDGANKFYRLKK